MNKRIVSSILAAAMTLGTAACIQATAHGTEAHQPAAGEFGFGPRASARQIYSVTLQPAQELRLRQLQTVRVAIADAEGRPVEGAAISVDGGMPSHGHGLPTQPRVKRSLGGGVYEIEGVRFSMGGWWQIRLAIDSPVGADNVTFNLSL
jgi:hypothetical protein